MRNLMKLALALAPAAGLVLAASGAGAAIKGDVNADGTVDHVDVMMLKKHFIGAVTLSTSARAAADVAPFVPDVSVGNGTLGIADLGVLAQAVATDLDGDGLGSEIESQIGTTPLDPTSYLFRHDGSVDSDGDGLGVADEVAAGTDFTDPDSDDDGLLDGFEVQFDLDPLAPGDEDDDLDGDGLDNLAEQANDSDPNLIDGDGDGVTDPTDPCPLDEFDDEDGDGVCRNHDNCPVTASASQSDFDGDGIGDACDLCPLAAGSDPDGDGVCGAADNCPDWSNATQADANLDGIGDDCQCGDVTGDGDVTLADVTAIEDGFATSSPTPIPVPARCDVNSDGVCSPDDAVHLDAALALPPGDVRTRCPALAEVRDKVLGRIGYGPDAWTRQRYAELPLTDYVDEQLHPETLADPTMAAKLVPYVSGSRATWGKSIAQLRTEYCNMGAGCPAPVGSPAQVTYNLSEIKFLHMVHSRRQLETALLDFWFNHFNVNGGDEIGIWAAQHFEQEAIRPNAFGKFEDLLLAVTKAPAMLDYLDLQNDRYNALNENYARELMELYTVGPEGTYGNDDIREVARVLSGYRYNTTTYVFQYTTGYHDPGVKQVTFEENGVVTDTWTFDGNLGCDGEPAASFENEGHVLLCLLSRHPKTAELVSRKLLQRFVSESPDEDTVEAIKQVWLATDGDLRAVMNAILSSEAFQRALYLDQKVKRPSVSAASLVRILGPGSEGTSLITTGNLGQWPNSFRGIMGDLATGGEWLHRAGPPTGYSEESPTWAGVGTILVRANQAARVLSSLTNVTGLLGVPSDASKEVIVERVSDALLTGRLSPEDRVAMELFLGTLPGTPTLEQKVRAAASVLLASPGFQAH